MKILNGPVKMILINSGKYAYAEVELDLPLHLVGPNNVGKTSLIAALQFLYMDMQRHMNFSRPMDETRRYYFPDPSSYILFECRTPAGFQVLGVHGLGPVKRFEFERFAYQGRYEFGDFLDEERRVRPAEEIKAGLAPRGYIRLDPQNLRAALTGIGEGRGIDLGLVPIRNRGDYLRFRDMFRNLLRLSHLRQDELKELILTVNRGLFKQMSIELQEGYSAHYRRVKSQTEELRGLRLMEERIRTLLSKDKERLFLRRRLPVMRKALETIYRKEEEESFRKAGQLTRDRDQFAERRREIEKEVLALQEEHSRISRRIGELDLFIREVEALEKRFKGFIPEMKKAALSNLEKETDRLKVMLANASGLEPDEVEARIRSRSARINRVRRLIETAMRSSGPKLLEILGEEDLSKASLLFNSELLGLPLGEDGIILRDEDAFKRQMDVFTGNISDDLYQDAAIAINFKGLEAPDIRRYFDRERLKGELQGLLKRQEQEKALLEICREEALLKKRLSGQKREIEALRRAIYDFEKFRERQQHLEERKRERQEAIEREREIGEALSRAREEIDRLILAIREIDEEEKVLKEGLEKKRKMIAALPRPAEDWPGAEPGDADEQYQAFLKEGLFALISAYSADMERERALSSDMERLFADIEAMSNGRFSAVQEEETIGQLKEELEGIEEKEKAVKELWKSLAVGLKTAFRDLSQDMETLKAQVSRLNRSLSKVGISNLTGLRLVVAERPRWMSRIRAILQKDDMPLFSDPVSSASALEDLGELLREHPRVELKDLFDMHFEIRTPDGLTRTYPHLESIESHGTTITIKVLINLLLIRDLLIEERARIPFYLDEVSSLDQANLKAIVEKAEELGFVPVLASPEPMAVARNIYMLKEQEGRVVLDDHSRITLEPERGGSHGA